MSLLFDQNLSPKLVHQLRDIYPRSCHVRDVGLASADDVVVWDYAALNGLAIVSKDADFRQRSFLVGAPPKVISIGIGNSTTNQIEQLLRSRFVDVVAFLQDEEAALILLT